MLSRLVGFSIEFRGVVIALACVVAGYGIYTTVNAHYDVYPEFAPPQVVVQTEAPGMAPEDVERLVTRPVEYAMAGLPGVESNWSESIQGLSVVTVLFKENTDIYRARQVISERLGEVAGQLPQDARAPTMAPLTGATSLVMAIGLTSSVDSPMQLRTFADWTLGPRLLGVPDVAQVSIYGGDVRQLQVQVRPDRMAAYRLSLNDVIAAAKTATGVRGAGFVETSSQRVVLQTMGQSLTPQQLGEVVLTDAGGMVVRLKDVASVRDAAAPKIGGATIMGRKGILLMVQSQYGSNTLAVTQSVDEALSELAPSLRAAKIQLHPDLFRPANFVLTSVHSISEALIIGAVLVAIVLLLFLFNLRVAIISLTAIPLSLLVAVIVLDRSGHSLNTMTLSGLAIAIGEVVDDAIIDAENIFRRLRETGAGKTKRELFNMVLQASVEVRSAVVYATFIVILVFVPVLTMTGVQGRLFGPLGLAYIYAIAASLIVALTLTPALSYVLLPPSRATGGDPKYIAAAKQRYAFLLRWSVNHRWPIVSAAACLILVACLAFPFLGGSFLPPLREGHFVVHMTSLPGTSLQESERMGRYVTAAILRDSDVRSVAQQIGRAELGVDTAGVNYSEFQVDLKSLSPGESTGAEDRLRRVLDGIPGASFSTKTFLTERMEELASGARAQVVIRVFGNDLDALDDEARHVLSAIVHVPGVTDAQIASPPGTPRLIIRLRSDRLQQFGFRPVEVLDSIQALYQGAMVGQVYDQNRMFDVTVVLPSELQNRPEFVRRILLQNSDGVRVPLAELADIFDTTGRYSISHYGTRRVQAILCNVRDRPVSSVVRDAETAIQRNVRFQPGDYAVFAGVSESRRQAQRQLVTNSAIAGVGIVLFLFIAFRNVPNTMLVLANLPFALVGGVLAAFITGGDLSVGSMVGFVGLFGITTRNSIMMISHFEHLVRYEGREWGVETAIEGAVERFNPVMMTAIVTGLGLLPLALGSGQPGKEIEGPMAIVILGGLVTSTALNLIMLPTLALRFARFDSNLDAR